MIHAEVRRNDAQLLSRIYADPHAVLADVVKGLEFYVKAEQLNLAGECIVRAWHPDLKEQAQ